MKRLVIVGVLLLLSVLAFSATLVPVDSLAKTRRTPNAPTLDAQSFGAITGRSASPSELISRIVDPIKRLVAKFEANSDQSFVVALFQLIKSHVEALLQKVGVDTQTDDNSIPTMTEPKSPQDTGSGDVIQVMGASWNHDPLTVAVTVDPGIDGSLRNDVVSALVDWENILQTSSGNHQQFKFQLTENPQLADIAIRVIGRSNSQVLGVTDVKTLYGSIVSAEVTLATAYEYGQLSHADLRNVARHEIGHALGLGHAEHFNSNELMSPTYDSVRMSSDLEPSKCDVDALLGVYDTDGFGHINHVLTSHKC